MRVVVINLCSSTTLIITNILLLIIKNIRVVLMNVWASAAKR